MSWNLQEFRKRCNNRGLTDTTIYQNTLHAKRWRTQVFSDKAVRVWEELFASRDKVSTGDPEWGETFLMAESYAEAALQALHSMVDVLAQIINVVIFSGTFTEDNVSMNQVSRHLQQNNLAPNVANTIQQFLSSNEFRYANGFVNTIKHRRLVDAEFRAEGGTDIEFRQGLRFEQFSYNGENFAEMWDSEILNILIPRFIDGISAIGNSVNEWLL